VQNPDILSVEFFLGILIPVSPNEDENSVMTFETVASELFRILS